MAPSLVQSARINGHDPWAYLRDVLQRLPTQLNSRIPELLPHWWQPSNILPAVSTWADWTLTKVDENPSAMVRRSLLPVYPSVYPSVYP